MAELADSQPSPSPSFAFQLVDHLYDEEAALAPVRAWLERAFRRPLSELASREQDRQAKDQMSISSAFASLRQLALLDWRQIFEHVSGVERILRQDPSGVYTGMDFPTRDRYRRAVEEVARRCGQAEETVARHAIELAARAARTAARDTRRLHVGTYLVGEGRPELDRLVSCRQPLQASLRMWAYHHHSAVYFLALGLFSGLLVSLIVLLGMGGQPIETRILIFLLSLIPASQLALELVNYLIMRVFPPRTLAKMDFEQSGIPDAFRTLVVVPMLLADAHTVRREVDRLEIRYLANREDNLLFSLFTDFADSDTAHGDGDELLLQAAVTGLEKLNQRYGGGRFFLFHRERVWSRSEQKYIGWERKRGKLEEQNRLIDATRPESAGRLVHDHPAACEPFPFEGPQAPPPVPLCQLMTDRSRQTAALRACIPWARGGDMKAMGALANGARQALSLLYTQE
jgi:cyclic beta-1,2-glucan synthetase